MSFMFENKNRNKIKKRFLIFLHTEFKSIKCRSFYTGYGFYYRQSMPLIIVNIRSELRWLFIDIIEQTSDTLS